MRPLLKTPPKSTGPDEVTTMIENCYAYRKLIGKRDELRLELSEGERQRLTSLERLFRERADECPLGVPEYAWRDHRRRPVELKVELQHEGGVERGLVRDVSGGGLLVETMSSLRPGATVMLRLRSTSGDREWRFGAVVARVNPGRGLGLRFVGLPVEVHVGQRGRLRSAA